MSAPNQNIRMVPLHMLHPDQFMQMMNIPLIPLVPQEPTLTLVAESTTVKVVLDSKENQYYYQGESGVCKLKLNSTTYEFPSGTQVQIYDETTKKWLLRYLVPEKHSTGAIPRVVKYGGYDNLRLKYPVNYYGFAYEAPVGTFYHKGDQPTQTTSVPTKFILSQHCKMVLPKGTLVRNVEDATDAYCYPHDKVAYLADTIPNDMI